MKKNHQPYIKWYSSDFLAGVRGLSSSQIGIYVILINEMYERTAPLPINNKRLAWQCGCTQTTFKKTLEMLISEGKIIIIDDCLWNNRVEKEFKNRKKRSDTAKANAFGRRKKPNEINGSPEQQHSKKEAIAMLIPETRNHIDKSNTDVLQKNKSNGANKNVRKCQVTKVLPSSDNIPDEYLEYATDHGIRNIHELFKDWHEWWDGEAGLKAGAKGWLLTWQRKVRVEQDKQSSGGSYNAGSSRNSTSSTLDAARMVASRRRDREQQE